MSELETTARALVAAGKGILAADESGGTIAKRFDAIGVESTEENRRAYRELLFTHAGRRGFISGRDPLRRDDAAEGRRRRRRSRSCSRSKGIVPGIKVDKGAKALALAPGEKVTEGLDGLARAARRVPRARRAVRQVARGDHDRRRHPERVLPRANAHALARYAALAQEAGIVPIVEPEVLMDGDHTIERCYDGHRRAPCTRCSPSCTTSACCSRGCC